MDFLKQFPQTHSQREASGKNIIFFKQCSFSYEFCFHVNFVGNMDQITSVSFSIFF